jgi:hypothetical protein
VPASRFIALMAARDRGLTRKWRQDFLLYCRSHFPYCRMIDCKHWLQDWQDNLLFILVFLRALTR